MVVLLIILLLLPFTSWAAVAFDTATDSEGTTSTTHNHTAGSGATLAIICVAARESGGAIANVASVTYGGNNATFHARQATGGVTLAEMWYYPNPPASAQSVVATGGAGTDFMVTGVMTFTGSATTSPLGTAVPFTSGGTTNVDLDAIASAVGEMGVACGNTRQANGSTVTVSADATVTASDEQFERRHSPESNSLAGWGYTEPGAATSINMRIDQSGSAQVSAVAASIAVAPAGASQRPISPMVLQ